MFFLWQILCIALHCVAMVVWLLFVDKCCEICLSQQNPSTRTSWSVWRKLYCRKKNEFLPTISKPLIALAYKKIPTVWCLKAKLEGDLAEENELISLKKAAGRGWRNSVMERRIYGRSGQWWMMMVERIWPSFHHCFSTWYDLFLPFCSRNQ